MTNVTPTAPNPVTDKQMAAALALADILDHGLPPIHWGMSTLRPGHLEGHACHTSGTQAERDAIERDAVRAFAQFLGVDYHETDWGGWTEASAYGTYEGVSVRVWANVDHVEEIAKEAAVAALAAKGGLDAKPVSV